MAEENDNTPVRTTTDLELEKLTARLDALESENRELREANQGLWSQLHPVVQEQPLPTVQPERDVAYEVLAEKLGLKD